jgi:hypothetical protein
MPQFGIICLANSRKNGGHCVAGLRMDGGGWLRPVGVPPDGILWPRDYTLKSGAIARPLDVIRVGVRKPRPAVHQPENWVTDGTPWTLLPRPSEALFYSVLRNAVVAGPELLGGFEDRVPFAQFASKPAPASLALVAPEDLYLYHHLNSRGKLRARGRFPMGTGEKARLYDLPITDPHWEADLLQKRPRTLRRSEDEFLVTISLGEPFEGHCYKLIAAIMPLHDGFSYR